MKNLDLYSSIFWFILCVLIGFHSLTVGLGTIRSPGPGFLFFWTAVTMGIFSIAVFASAVMPAKLNRAGSAANTFGNVSWRRLCYILIPLIMYGLVLERLGYLLSTFLLMAFLLVSTEVKRWYLVVLVACASSFLSYAVFALLLGVRLPKGMFGF
jgi:hypothetical protein